MTKRRGRRVAPAVGAVLAVLMIGGAGCSASPDGTSRVGTADGREQAVRFATCMRDNGVAGFPDPDASGQLTIDAIANGSSVDPSSPAFEQARQACKDLEPAGFTGPGPATPEQQDERLAFARCIREHGVPDFPDPAPDAPLVDTNVIPSSDTADGMRILDAAMQACGDLVADLVQGR